MTSASTPPGATGTSRAGPDAAGPDAAGPDADGPDAAGPDADGPSAEGPDVAGPYFEAGRGDDRSPGRGHGRGADRGPDQSPGRGHWAELAPLIRRVARLDGAAAMRLRRRADRLTALAVLPSGALVGRTVEASVPGPPTDWTARAQELLWWLEEGSEPISAGADVAWTRAVPPSDGWRRVDSVPADVVRDLVRHGAEAHRQAADRDLGARAAQTLLEAPVLTLTGGDTTAHLSNRELAALVSMAFLPDHGAIIVARCGRWTRAAAQFGSVFAEDQRGGLTLL